MEDIFLRYAVQQDAIFLFELVNDKECRINSLKTQEITLEQHMDWFYEVLNSKTKKQYILMEGVKPIGQGRLESIEKICRISYSIIPEHRGCGYGKRLIQLLGSVVMKDFPECAGCFAEVLKENVASQKIFEETGYVAEERGNYFYYYKNIENCKIDQESIEKPGGGILLLSNNRNSYILYQWLKAQKEQVYFYSGRLTETQIIFLSPQLVVSYNYSYLIPKNIIRLVEKKIINLHISYLPWNKGSDPNFWSFMDDTPKGVTIHQLTSALDQGDILLQKEIFFNEKEETFRSTYETLNREIVAMFIAHFQRIKNRMIIPYAQQGMGTYHRRQDFIDFMDGNKMDWNETIYDFKQKYNEEVKRCNISALMQMRQ